MNLKFQVGDIVISSERNKVFGSGEGVILQPTLELASNPSNPHSMNLKRYKRHVKQHVYVDNDGSYYYFVKFSNSVYNFMLTREDSLQLKLRVPGDVRDKLGGLLDL